jgi:hypothetical protein
MVYQAQALPQPPADPINGGLDEVIPHEPPPPPPVPRSAEELLQLRLAYTEQLFHRLETAHERLRQAEVAGVLPVGSLQDAAQWLSDATAALESLRQTERELHVAERLRDNHD